MKKISKKMTLGELAEKFPKAAEILESKYGMHCLGCPLSQMETLEDGARAHGMSEKEIEEIVKKLNCG